MIAWVQKNRGRIARDDKQPDRPVVSVDLYPVGRTDMDDADVKRLSVFPNLRSLNVGFSIVTDAGLKVAATFPELEYLNLCFTRVSDTGLKELASLKGLKTVYLYATKVTASGMAELKEALPECNVTQVEVE